MVMKDRKRGHMLTRSVLTAAAVCSLALCTGTQVFAGSFVQDAAGVRYQSDNGTFVTGTWYWIDANGDGMAQCYCFDANGYLVTSQITPDGHQVDASGAYMENGAVVSIPDSSIPGADPLDYNRMTKEQAAAYLKKFNKVSRRSKDPDNIYDGLKLMDVNGDGIIDMVLDNMEHSSSADRAVKIYTYDAASGSVSLMDTVEINHMGSFGLGADGSLYTTVCQTGQGTIYRVDWNAAEGAYQLVTVFDSGREDAYDLVDEKVEELGVREPVRFSGQDAKDLLGALSRQE